MAEHKDAIMRGDEAVQFIRRHRLTQNRFVGQAGVDGAQEVRGRILHVNDEMSALHISLVFTAFDDH